MKKMEQGDDPNEGDLKPPNEGDSKQVSVVPKKRKKPAEESASTAALVARVRHKSIATSYADLITRAILSTVDKRMTLADIYDWMVSNVAELHTQQNVLSSKGWKNAVRHTLSINPRFRKIARIGRPGWWTIENIEEELRGTTVSNSFDVDTSSLDIDTIGESSATRLRCESEPAYSLLKVILQNITGQSVATYGSAIKRPAPEGLQKVYVKQDSGAFGFVTIPPVYVKSEPNRDTGTQTDKEETHMWDIPGTSSSFMTVPAQVEQSTSPSSLTEPAQIQQSTLFPTTTSSSMFFPYDIISTTTGESGEYDEGLLFFSDDDLNLN